MPFNSFVQNVRSALSSSEPVVRMSRGSLQIRVTKDGMSLDLINAHLKSKLLTFPRLGGGSFTPRDEGERAPDVDSLIDFVGELSSVGDNPGARAQEVAPDHAPVIASFDL